MNQIAASILVLAGSICAFASLERPIGDYRGNICLLAAVSLALWGGLSLLSSVSRMPTEDHHGSRTWPAGGGLATWRSPSGFFRKVDADANHVEIDEDTLSQLDRLARQRGKSANELAEFILRQHLDRFPAHRRMA